MPHRFHVLSDWVMGAATSVLAISGFWEPVREMVAQNMPAIITALVAAISGLGIWVKTKLSRASFNLRRDEDEWEFVKQQVARIPGLEARIDELRLENSELRSKIADLEAENERLRARRREREEE